MNANSPFYIDRHPGSLSLDGEWHFGWADAPAPQGTIVLPESLPHKATLPASGYRCLYEAGILPDPYFGTNSKLYDWTDKKFWTFARTFSLPAHIAGKDIFLCFEGVSYFCRLTLNGREILTHEGMFGGPTVEISSFVHPGENLLSVEITPPACDFYRCKTNHDPKSLSQIVPWNNRRDSSTSNGDFIVFGIWRSVRVEIVPRCHLSRPHLYTESLENGTAKLRLWAELADEQVNELDVLPNDTGGWSKYTFAYSAGMAARPTGRQVGLTVTLTEKDTGRIALTHTRTVDILDKRYTTPNEEFRECQFIETVLMLENPRLWWPSGMGEASLYEVTLSLSDADGCQLDRLCFDTGIRTLEYRRSAGQRMRTRWEDWHYIINGQPFFVKGMNWMPVDFLFDCRREEYRWTLELAKNAGIQLLRVWSGGGMPEDDIFYSICDELGLLVMQDSLPANGPTGGWPRKVLQSQVCYNLYRIRNHPSLANHTGGNEINPYSEAGDASMWVIAREIADLDPSRKFYNTSPDKGSAHIYRDMEPVWYRKAYSSLPFISESGIHSFPNAKTIRQVIAKEEFDRPLSDIYTDAFPRENPQLHNHFTEFIPERIPRMMSRASMITDTRGIGLADLCEATQMASHEFYQIMADAMRENYPVTCGMMPWVFRRPWPTTAIQLVDGLGDPTASYYAMKNGYAPLAVSVALEELCYGPGEVFTPILQLICDSMEAWEDLTVTLEIYDPALRLIRSESFPAAIDRNTYRLRFDTAALTIPEEWSEKYFLLRAVCRDSSGAILHQSVYRPKVLARFSDPDVRKEYRASVHPNIDFVNGPWLKDQIAVCRSAMMAALIDSHVTGEGDERRLECRIRITNKGSLPLYPVRADSIEDKTLTMASDGYFFLDPSDLDPSDLEPSASAELSLTVRVRDAALDTITVSVTAWNADPCEILIPLQ